jgi:hypothetical protein
MHVPRIPQQEGTGHVAWRKQKGLISLSITPDHGQLYYGARSPVRCFREGWQVPGAKRRLQRKLGTAACRAAQSRKPHKHQEGASTTEATGQPSSTNGRGARRRAGSVASPGGCGSARKPRPATRCSSAEAFRGPKETGWRTQSAYIDRPCNTADNNSRCLPKSDPKVNTRLHEKAAQRTDTRPCGHSPPAIAAICRRKRVRYYSPRRVKRSSSAQPAPTPRLTRGIQEQ